MRDCLDPQGCCVDLLRRCYTTTAQWNAAGRQGPIRWYWCLPDAAFLGRPTKFGSAVFDDDRNEVRQGPGEVRGAPVKYVNGLFFPRAPGIRPFAGDPSYWTQGTGDCTPPARPRRGPWRSQILDGFNAE